jgi:hypothetical protein
MPPGLGRLLPSVFFSHRSFGQICGISALDEPTNALDVENIDAVKLAASPSLVQLVVSQANRLRLTASSTKLRTFLIQFPGVKVKVAFWKVFK